MEDTVRVLRIIEYVGPRSRVEEVVNRSVHGTRTIPGKGGDITIRAATIGNYPELLDMAKKTVEHLFINEAEEAGSGT